MKYSTRGQLKAGIRTEVGNLPDLVTYLIMSTEGLQCMGVHALQFSRVSYLCIKFLSIVLYCSAVPLNDSDFASQKLFKFFFVMFL